MSSSRPSKRQRICRACDQCRRRKSKCDGRQPECLLCRSAGRTCTYVNGGGRRGLPSGYVRSLETALGLIFQHVPSSEGTLLGVLRELKNRGGVSANRAADVWQKSKAARGLSELLKGGSREHAGDEGMEEEQEWDYEMPDVSTLLEGAPEALDSAPREATLSLPSPAPPSLPPPQIAPPEPIKEVIDLQIPENTADLLDSYFHLTHCWFPIVERRELLRAMHTTPGQSTKDAGSHLVLWASIAYVSGMNQGPSSLETPDAIQIQIAIQQRVIASWGTLQLSHIQALTILVLLHLGLGNIQQAWVLLGLTTRMLEMLPMSARTSRYRNTFHGCVLLDNITSALLSKAPCLSKEEQSQHGPVDTDDVEEWDIWSIARLGSHINRRTAPNGPLRALSTFNLIQQHMQLLSRILYSPIDTTRPHELLVEMQEKQALLLAHHPYPSTNSISPTFLTMHLTAAFTILSLIYRFNLFTSTSTQSAISTSHRTLDLLDNYYELTQTITPSPLLRCYALQCRQCLDSMAPSVIAPKLDQLRVRLSAYLQKFGINDGTTAIFNTTQSQSQPRNTNIQDISTPCSLDPPAPQVVEPATETERFDTLFEEMVTLMPNTSVESEFAYNLGFHGGDLDTDFVVHLQQPPQG